jgi:ankyrin repeat protein
MTPTVTVTYQEEDKFLQELHNNNYRAYLNDHYDNRYCPGTGQWFVEEPRFIEWEKSPRSESIWLRGDAGSGKTIMATFVIKELQNRYPNTNDSMILYHFCNHSTQADVFSSLLHQILSERRRFISLVATDLLCGDSFWQDTPRLQEALSLVLDRAKISKLFLVVDALDECIDDDCGDLVPSLLSLAKANPCFKIFFTSRTVLQPVARAVHLQSGSIHRLSLRPNPIADDIATYFRKQLDVFEGRFLKMQPPVREKVEATLRKHAGSIFLMAYFAWNVFQELGGNLDPSYRPTSRRPEVWKLSDVDIQLEKVRELGHTLPNAYIALLKRIADFRAAKKLLQWLVVARRPLTTVEVQWILALHSSALQSPETRPTHSSILEVRDNELPTIPPAENIKRVCGLLVHIVAGNQTVQIVHHSVQEYLLDEDSEWGFTKQEAEIECTRGCLAYLSLDDFSSPELESQHIAHAHSVYKITATHADEEEQNDQCLRDALPMLEYSSRFWASHLAQVEEQIITAYATDDGTSEFRRFICRQQNMHLAFRIFWYFGGTVKFPRNASPLHILCFYGLRASIKALFDDPNFDDSRKELWLPAGGEFTPFHMAAMTGQSEVIRLLLEKREDRAADDMQQNGATPIRLAADFGHHAIVELLLEYAEHGGHLGEELVVAASAGHCEIVELLLDRGADFNAHTELHGTALEVAAFNNHIEVVDLLLKRGADVDGGHYTEGPYGTPLQAACYHGRDDIVALLLRHGADPNIEGGKSFSTALYAAAFRGWPRCIEMLLEKGANIDYQGGTHGTPLQAALFANRTEAIAVLRNHGANEVYRERGPSVLDPGAEMSVSRVAEAAESGRMGLVEGRIAVAVKEFQAAIANHEIKSLDHLLGLSEGMFKVGIRIGRVNLLEVMAKKGMEIIQMAVAARYTEGVQKLATCWAECLHLAVEKKKVLLVRKMLELCIADAKELIEKGRNEDDENAKNIIRAGIELYLVLVKLEKKETVSLVAEVWVIAFDDLLSGRFESNLISVINEYADLFQAGMAATVPDWTSMRTIACTLFTTMQMALSLSKFRLVDVLGAVCSPVLNQIYAADEISRRWFPAAIQAKETILLADLLVSVVPNLLLHEELVERRMFEALIIGGVEWLLRTAAGVRRPTELEFLINRVARKQIRAAGDGRAMESPRVGPDERRLAEDRQKASISAIFDLARKNPTEGNSVRISEALERIITGLSYDRWQSEPSSTPRGRRKGKQSPVLSFAKHVRGYLCIG